MCVCYFFSLVTNQKNRTIHCYFLILFAISNSGHNRCTICVFYIYVVIGFDVGCLKFEGNWLYERNNQILGYILWVCNSMCLSINAVCFAFGVEWSSCFCGRCTQTLSRSLVAFVSFSHYILSLCLFVWSSRHSVPYWIRSWRVNVVYRQSSVSKWVLGSDWLTFLTVCVRVCVYCITGFAFHSFHIFCFVFLFNVFLQVWSCLFLSELSVFVCVWMWVFVCTSFIIFVYWLHIRFMRVFTVILSDHPHLWLFLTFFLMLCGIRLIFGDDAHPRIQFQ